MAKPRISTLLLVIALLTASIAAVNFYIARNAEHATRVWTEDQLKKTREAKKALEDEKEELTKAKTALEEQVADLTKNANAVADQLAQEKRAKEALTTELAQVRRDSTQMKSQLDSERNEKQSLTADLAKTKQSYQALSNELTTLRQAKEALEKRVKEMLAARAKEAEQIVVSGTGAAPTGAPTATSSTAGTTTGTAGGTQAAKPTTGLPATSGGGGGRSLEGKVLVINREFNFIVINLGTKDAVNKGSRFAVLRGGKPITTVEVEKVYENMSAANMLEETKKGTEVQEGDAVRLIS